MKSTEYTLADLGWRPMLQQQLTFDELDSGFAARVDAVFRDRVHVLSEFGEFSVPLTGPLDSFEPEQRATTGDWLWLENHTHRPLKLFERNTLLKRTAAGTDPKAQLLAANIDTLFIVSSCNQDFNVSRFERYLSLVLAAHIPAVIVLTKSDLSDDPDAYVEQASRIHRDVPVLAVNALGGEIYDALQQWLGRGQTVAFIGSSGVGKSTLVNALMGEIVQDTGDIREDDGKGRHTTTGRCMLPLPAGGWVLDTPGMRELRLNDGAAAGVSELFDDIEALTLRCKFSNCHHQGDKGCAIEQAIADGELEDRRWQNYQKLQREARQAEQTKQQRQQARQQWGKTISKFQRNKKKATLR